MFIGKAILYTYFHELNMCHKFWLLVRMIRLKTTFLNKTIYFLTTDSWLENYYNYRIIVLH